MTTQQNFDLTSSNAEWVTYNPTGTGDSTTITFQQPATSIPLVGHIASSGSGVTSSVYNYYYIDPLDQFINNIVSQEEREDWLEANGYRRNETEVAMEHFRGRIKGLILAPKQEFKIKLPKKD